jgi:hypothetical protein
MPERRRSDRKVHMEYERIERTEHLEGGEAQAALVATKVPRAGIDFGLVVLTAIAIYFLWPYRTLIMGVGAIVIAWRCFNWICNRSPAAGWFMVGFLRGLMGYRRGRWW